MSRAIVSMMVVCALPAFLGTASAQPFPGPNSASAPKLSGNYVLTQVEGCSEVGVVSGIVDFNANNGKVTVTGYKAQKDSKHPKLQSDDGTETYSSTSSTLTVGAATYKASYGAVSGGIAQYVSIIGVPDGCVEAGWLVRK
jgi:hypothetical protein